MADKYEQQRKGAEMDEPDVYKRANFFSGLKATPEFWNDYERRTGGM